MPSVQDFLAGNAQFADINEREWKQYVEEQQKQQQALLDSSKKASTTMGALRVRQVTSQAQASRNAPSSAAYPSRPGPPPPAPTTAGDAKNKIRHVFADDPFAEVSHFGPNSVIPDAHHYMMLSNEIDRNLVSTRKFTEISEFWTPLHGKYFDGVLFIVQSMRAYASTNTVSTQIQDVLDLFEGAEATYPLTSIPVPGPLENVLSTISSSYTQYLDYDPVRIFVPATPNSTAANSFVLNNNACMRFPPIPLFLNLLHNIHSADLTATIWRDLYVRPVYGLDLRHLAAAAPNAAVDPTSYSQSYQLLATTADTVKRQINSPGVLPTFFGANNFTQFNAYRESVSIPNYAPAQQLPAAELTWLQFLGLDDPDFFQACLRIASIRAKFFKSSTPMSSIQPAGHMGAQTVSTRTNMGTAANRTSHRFPTANWTFDAIIHNPLVPDSDRIDSILAPINLAHLPAGTNGHNTGAISEQGTSTSMATNRLGGPFFANSTTVKRALRKNPAAAYGNNVTAHYYSPVPLRD